jgi:hypothetical protein
MDTPPQHEAKPSMGIGLRLLAALGGQVVLHFRGALLFSG